MLTQITPDVVTSNVLVNAAISYFSSNTANAIVNGSTIIPYSLPGNAHANGSILGTQLANNLSISGNTNFNNVPSSTTPTNIGVVQVGSILNFTDVNIQMGLAQSVNNYTQIILQNSNTGTLASADFIVNNDSPAGTTIYGDFGINSTIFSGSGAFADANGTYAYASGGTMSIGTYGANNLKFATNNTTALTIDTNGNLGLGVTPSAWTIGKVLQIGTSVGNGFLYGGGAGSTTWYGVNNYYGSGGYTYATSYYATQYRQDPSTGQHQWFNAPSGTAGNAITFTQAMTLDANGNLGLGVTPSAWSGVKVIEVYGLGSALLSGGNNDIELVSNAYFNGSWKYAATGAAAHYYQSSGVHYWRIANSGSTGGTVSFTQAMTLDNSGRLGIGTSSPQDYLDVYGNARIGQGQISSDSSVGVFSLYGGLAGSTTPGQIKFFGKSVSNTGQTYEIARISGISASSSYALAGGIQFSVANNNGSNVLTLSEAMRLDTNGNLGLGTTPSSWGSGRPAIEMNSSIAAYIVNNNTGSLQLQNNSYYNGSVNVAKVTGAGSSYSQYQGSHVWYLMASVSAGATQTFTQAMTLFNSGGLSLGNTTDPGGSNLSVNGTVIAGKFNSSTVYTGSGVSGTSPTLTLSARSIGFIQVFGIGTATERMTMYHFSNCGPTSVQASITQLNTQGFNLSFTIATVNNTGGFTVSWSGSNSASITVNVIYLGQTF